MRLLLVLCLILCAGLVLAGGSPLFPNPAIPLAQTAVGPGVDIVWGDTIQPGDARFDDQLNMETVQTQIAVLDSLGFTLDLKRSCLNLCRAAKPGSADTMDVESLHLNFDNNKADARTAQLVLVKVPAKGFESPPMAVISSFSDPGDSTYMQIPAGVDSDGNDRYIWMKYLIPETPDSTSE